MEKKHYAFAEHETIQAMLHTLFRFQSLEQAQLITNRLALEFTLAPKLSDPLDKKTFVMWVRDLEVTPEQKKLGYLGNFGRVTIHKLPKGKWTLTLVKIDLPLNKHPLRKAVPRRHPNMGHPVIRAAMRNKTWPSMQAAGAELMRLHEEFPEISVPGVNRLRILTYVKAEKGMSPVQRLELNVVKRDEGVYIIDVKNLSKKRLPNRPLMQPGDDAPLLDSAADMPAASLSADTQSLTPEQAPDQAKEVLKAEAKKPEGQKVAGFYTNLVTKGRKRKKK